MNYTAKFQDGKILIEDKSKEFGTTISTHLAFKRMGFDGKDYLVTDEVPKHYTDQLEAISWASNLWKIRNQHVFLCNEEMRELFPHKPRVLYLVKQS